MTYSSDWIPDGWTRVNGKWMEMGHDRQVTSTPPPLPPELRIHEVASRLNFLEDMINELSTGVNA